MKGNVAINYISCGVFGFGSTHVDSIKPILMELISDIASNRLVDEELRLSLNSKFRF